MYHERNSFHLFNIFFLFCLECTENVNQLYGRLDVSYTSKFDPHCNWIVGDAGIPQAVTIVSIHQMKLRDNSRYVVVIF